jgi:hypothetical protein
MGGAATSVVRSEFSRHHRFRQRLKIRQAAAVLFAFPITAIPRDYGDYGDLLLSDHPITRSPDHPIWF